MIEENAIAGEQPKPFAVVDGCPICIEFRATVGTARTKGSGFALRSFGGSPEHLAARSLIEFCLNPRLSYRFQQTDRAHCGYIAGVFRYFKAYQNMALSPQMIDFIGLKAIEKSD